MNISNFILNSACLPLYSNADAFLKAEDVFRGYLNYIGEKEKIILIAEKDPSLIIIAEEGGEKTTLSNWIEMISYSDKDFYSFLQDVFDTINILSDKDLNPLYELHIKINESTAYCNNTSLKFSLKYNKALLSITDNTFWQRTKLFCSFYGCHPEIIYNLYSSDVSQLPFEIPPFSLNDETRFRKTGQYNNGSIVYIENDTGYYWYEDKFHKKTYPHYEVFSSLGIHMGEADMKGNLDKSKADNKKRLSVS